MSDVDRRLHDDRRRVSRGGRRATDRAGAHPTLLVADHYDGARLPLVRYLQRHHFDIVEAAHGEQALRTIVARPPHVIVVDWALPLLPAPRLCQWLDQSWRARAIPVIVMIGDYEPGEDLPPVAGILVKPFPLAAMVEAVRRAIRLAQHSA